MLQDIAVVLLIIVLTPLAMWSLIFMVGLFLIWVVFIFETTATWLKCFFLDHDWIMIPDEFFRHKTRHCSRCGKRQEIIEDGRWNLW